MNSCDLEKIKELHLKYDASVLKRVVNLPLINNIDPRTNNDNSIQWEYDRFLQKYERKYADENGDELPELGEVEKIQLFMESLKHGKNTLLYDILHTDPYVCPKFKEIAKCLINYGAIIHPDTKFLIEELGLQMDFIFDSELAVLSTIPLKEKSLDPRYKRDLSRFETLLTMNILMRKNLGLDYEKLLASRKGIKRRSKKSKQKKSKKSKKL